MKFATVPPRATPRLVTLLMLGVLLVACGGTTPQAPAAQPTAAPAAQPTAAPAAQPTAAPAAGEKIKVAILNKEMTNDEIKAEVQKEGSVVVGNWTYTANDQLV